LTASPCPQLTEEQKREQRAQLADAAEARSNNFNQARLSEDSPPSRVIHSNLLYHSKQGGGGEKIKAKQKAVENAKSNREAAHPARAYD
jgi:FKBP-type peptidyl-prolyl cis-trans isomerase